MRKFLIPIALILFLSSCQTTKPLFSYQPNIDLNDTLALQILQHKEPILSIGDKINMSIWGHDDLSIGSVNSVNESTGKWLILDDEGKVNLPKIGRVKLSGLTVKETNYFLEQQYGKLLKDPIINVRVLNHFVTILGEVNKPGRYSLENNEVSLIELLGKSEGLTTYAKTEHIELIRIINGQSVKLNINLSDLTSLPEKNIRLQPDDIVHIGATRAKQSDRDLGKASLITSIVTGVAVIISVFAK